MKIIGTWKVKSLLTYVPEIGMKSISAEEAIASPDEEMNQMAAMALKFTEDGKMRYGLTQDVISGLTGGEATKEDMADAMKGLEALMSIKYKVKSDTEMEITMSALMGLKKEKVTVTYKLDGDTLEFDGATYSRVK